MSNFTNSSDCIFGINNSRTTPKAAKHVIDKKKYDISRLLSKAQAITLLKI